MTEKKDHFEGGKETKPIMRDVVHDLTGEYSYVGNLEKAVREKIDILLRKPLERRLADPQLSDQERNFTNKLIEIIAEISEEVISSGQQKTFDTARNDVAEFIYTLKRLPQKSFKKTLHGIHRDNADTRAIVGQINEIKSRIEIDELVSDIWSLFQNRYCQLKAEEKISAMVWLKFILIMNIKRMCFEITVTLKALLANAKLSWIMRKLPKTGS